MTPRDRFVQRTFAMAFGAFVLAAFACVGFPVWLNEKFGPNEVSRTVMAVGMAMYSWGRTRQAGKPR